MLIVLTTITADRQWRDFYLLTDDLELGIEALLRIAQSGETIVEARLIDLKRSSTLPLDFLKQEPTCNPLRQLRQQWEKVLALPMEAHPDSKPVLPKWLEHQICAQQQYLNHLRQIISQMQELIQAAQETMDESPRKTRWLAHYQQTMDRCSRSIVRLETAPSLVNCYLQKASFR